MITILTTTDPVKCAAIRVILQEGGVDGFVLDSGAGGLWGAAIPLRIAVSEAQEQDARRLLRIAGFIAASDGDWDLRPERPSPQAW